MEMFSKTGHDRAGLHVANSKRPITKAEDLDGLKIRVIPNPVFLETFKSFKANPVPMPFAELHDALVNPIGLTQHGVPRHDAIKAMLFPTLEIHMSNIAAREAWRAHSIISPAVKGTIQGLGPRSYLAGLRALVEMQQDAEA